MEDKYLTEKKRTATIDRCRPLRFTGDLVDLCQTMSNIELRHLEGNAVVTHADAVTHLVIDGFGEITSAAIT